MTRRQMRLSPLKWRRILMLLTQAGRLSRFYSYQGVAGIIERRCDLMLLSIFSVVSHFRGVLHPNERML